jgi:hypothetical protein
MKPIFITTANGQPLMIIPDTTAHMDGHPVLTHAYSIYKVQPLFSGGTENDVLLVNKEQNPDYLGTLTFEQPGKLFAYTTTDGGEVLPEGQIEELIEELSNYRDNPQYWNI